MKELSLYKIATKEGKSMLCLSIRDLLFHLRELDVIASRDEKVVLSTLSGELMEALGEIKIEEPILSSNRQVEKKQDKERAYEKEPPKMSSSKVKKYVPESLDSDEDIGEESEEEVEEDIPRPAVKKTIPHQDIPDESEEADVEEEDNGEEFQLR